MSSTTAPRRAASRAGASPDSSARLRLADAALLVALLGLTFLLGVFPLKDVDYWWHLRTGDLIRATGQVPRTDPYTYTVPDHEWVDLHWGFQVLLSLGHDLGGVVGLNLAKCAITTLALLLLVTAKKPDWPLWAMVAAWLPALVLLGGRMYIRPETMTLLYLSMFLAILFRMDRRPWLGLLLPVVQVFWVNTQSLFVFGPILLGFWLAYAALSPGAFDPDRRRWWRFVFAAAVLDGLACLANPYGLRGAAFPFTDLLFGTMSDPIFKDTIAELSSVPKLIADNAGTIPFMLYIHAGVAGLGALSFVLPLLWAGSARLADLAGGPGVDDRPPAKSKGKRKASKKTRAAKERPAESATPGVLSPFRLLLFVAFTSLSWQATRNSHQFAAVVGTVTAWNFGEWAAAVRRRREARGLPARSPMMPRLAALAATAALIAFVGTGGLYAAADEDRTIGLGEERAWFPHRAVAFAGSPDLPPRFLGFHIGHDALYIYQHGPERKVFADPRLEVIGPELYRRYRDLDRALAADDPRSNWRGALEEAGRPVLLTDHLYNTPVGATLMADAAYRCLWFDEVAAVFAHRLDAEAAGLPAVDFRAVHFGTAEDAARPSGDVEWIAAAEGLNRYVITLIEARQRPDLARSLIPLGLDRAREARRQAPSSSEPWSIAAALEMARFDAVDPTSAARRRPGDPFDPISDLHAARAAYFAKRATAIDPEDKIAMTVLVSDYQQGGLDGAALPLLERMASRPPRTPNQARAVARTREELERVRNRLGPAPAVDVTNGNQIRRSRDALLATGRAAEAADLLEQQYPPGERDWETADLIARLRLRLGEPAAARDAWRSVRNPPDPAGRLALVAATYYAEDDLELARDTYGDALADDPDRFDALYGLALVEHDAGRAKAALDAARRALDRATTDAARLDLRDLIRALEPYATAPGPAVPDRPL